MKRHSAQLTLTTVREDAGEDEKDWRMSETHTTQALITGGRSR
jgi:hypothetical protein